MKLSHQPLRSAAERVRRHKAILCLLILAAALRTVLVLRGGQYFSQDEPLRFHPCLDVVAHLQHGEVGAALDVVAARSAHPGFFLIGTPIGAAYLGLVQKGIVTGMTDTLWVPALMLSSASVACILLTYLIALRAGADRREAVIAAFLMTCSNTMFFYARHLLPYDTSLALTLLVLWLGWRRRVSLWRSGLLGILAGLAYLTWFGSLMALSVVCAIHVLRARGVAGIVIRAVGTALGFVVPPLCFHVFTLVRQGVPFLGGVRAHMASARGEYAEGWRVVWEYLWHAEHGLLLVWAVGAALVVGLAIRRDGRQHVRGLVWVGAALAIYLVLTVESTLLHRAAMLGRFSRSLVPFLCLAAAYGARVLDREVLRSRLALTLAGLAIAAQAAFNFSVPLAQRFPFEVDRELTARYGAAGLTRELSVSGPSVPEMEEPNWPSKYVLLNTATYLYPLQGRKPPMARGRVLYREPHPLQFLPYQYEQYGARGRAILRSTDISMRLIDIEGAGHD